MMVSFMHYLKKYKGIVHLLFWLAMASQLFMTHAIAEDLSHLNIHHAMLDQVDDRYVLHAQIDAKFSHEMKQALLNGFQLHFILEFQLAVPRKYWFADEIVTVTQPITLKYMPISQHYLLTQGQHQQLITSLSAVANALFKLKPIPVFNTDLLEKEKDYRAKLLFRLDYNKLPSAIEYKDEHKAAWNMTSQLLEWTPIFSQ